MSADPYSPEVRRLFAAAEHARIPPGGAVVRQDADGVSIELGARASAGRLEQMGFRAYGCPHVIAAAEAVCGRFEGRPVASLAEFAVGELMQSLAVPAEKTGRLLVLEDAVRMLMHALGQDDDSQE
ncbi:MAG: hypothetical protein R3176_02195 [Woeseiaceae bacterium]|nr:hypothetical protein [Woeseiaceae bacterium]